MKAEDACASAALITWCQTKARMNHLPPPNPFTFEGNVAGNWRRWIQQFRLYLNATGLDKKPQQQLCSCLLTVAGPEALELFNTFALSDADQTKIEVVISKFEEYCTPKKNVTYDSDSSSSLMNYFTSSENAFGFALYSGAICSFLERCIFDVRVIK